SVTRSVRIEKNADERLRQLEEQGDTSVNTLVNRALRKFVEWDAYGEKFGFITLPSAMLVKLMDCLSDEEARELGVWAGKNLVQGGHAGDPLGRLPEAAGEVRPGIRLRGARRGSPAHDYPQTWERRQMVHVLRRGNPHGVPRTSRSRREG